MNKIKDPIQDRIDELQWLQVTLELVSMNRKLSSLEEETYQNVISELDRLLPLRSKE